MTSLPPGWTRAQNHTPWPQCIVVQGSPPIPDAIAVDEDPEIGGSISTTTTGMIYVAAPDESAAASVAWRIHRGLGGL